MGDLAALDLDGFNVHAAAVQLFHFPGRLGAPLCY